MHFGRSSSEKTLAGRIIVVTGASSGVGYALVRRLAQTEGATVVAVARRRVFRIEALARQIGADKIWAVTADMAARAQADDLAAQVQARWGRVDGFVHAVNRVLHLPALDVSDHEFDLTMQVNVKSALYGVQAFAPLLRSRHAGAVVLYNPIPARTDDFVASEAVYAASAHALSALAAGWVRQLAPCGVVVREVAPCAPHSEELAAASHDCLLADALRDALSVPASAPLLPPRRESLPIVLSARGGLALTEFSR